MMERLHADIPVKKMKKNKNKARFTIIPPCRMTDPWDQSGDGGSAQSPRGLDQNA
jgi:hypothetical protein